MSGPPPAYPDFVSTSSFSENKPPPAYVEDETDENLDPQALQAALRVEMARRKRLERALQRERKAAQRETTTGHLNHENVIRAPRREQPRTVGVQDINHRSGYRRSQACSISHVAGLFLPSG
ncbi:unnamed protein product, partial [Mesorhabditis belari]|uniref:Uncharacterized protein n=1 Tax=Mesorhabditis belari TaxID=2138241 RepID=A0AAF3EK25_9BILA